MFVFPFFFIFPSFVFKESKKDIIKGSDPGRGVDQSVLISLLIYPLYTLHVECISMFFAFVDCFWKLKNDFLFDSTVCSLCHSQCHLSASVFFYDGNKILYSKRNSRWSIEFFYFSLHNKNHQTPSKHPHPHFPNQQTNQKINEKFVFILVSAISNTYLFVLISLLTVDFQVYLIEHFIKFNQQQMYKPTTKLSEKIRLKESNKK